MSTIDLSRARWRTSSRSNGQGECIQVADLDGGHRAVRDSNTTVRVCRRVTAVRRIVTDCSSGLVRIDLSVVT
ncbi:MAG TPA: DUF397 domain-containing protein [Pseudonocardiaceae bacterium]|nr:DUF397 domain-containing protein [Pseudonocardiaceae bacterium]